ncbi:MAG TPA: hypothetical protein PK186_05420 [candidate division Zixibacteria bacterium]|nr:hypothetical protein [candidate division Zixibacteria bacterium]MDD4917637.1 hypothetical protein [candidate division Zixibacteria bacterium]MDM7973440.1 hypothetical protein [candidate division Zixibacteria bacterium]HOD65545.1 hypothetical protein [candidate division Zixibacteria bacterium]HPM36983.1 hypothetical protein [candidate division Zixibacteria bacterium]
MTVHDSALEAVYAALDDLDRRRSADQRLPRRADAAQGAGRCGLYRWL